MSMKRLFLIASLCLPAVLFAMGASSPRKVEVLVVPAQPNRVRVGLDVYEREGLVLMSYATQSDPAVPFLHVWNGAAWIRVPAPRYADGSFLKNRPARVFVVGGDNALTATLIEQAIGWTPEVLNLYPGTVTEFINVLGRQLQFSRSDWKWFADRYELELRNLSRDAGSASWYDVYKASDLPPPENPLKKRKSRPEAVPSTSLEPIPPAESAPPPSSDTKPAEPVEPMEPMEPMEPVEPVEPAEPVEPVEPGEPLEMEEETGGVDLGDDESPAEEPEEAFSFEME